MHQIILGLAVSSALFLAAVSASASPSYKDESWGVVPQDNGNACVVVLNSEDRMHAFHFAVDGASKRATLGILDSFVPERLSAPSPKITVDFGPLFVRQLQFEHRSDGEVGYLAANLSEDDLKTILAALENGIRDVTVSFANGEVWRIPGPKQAATAAIAQCWTDALTGIRVT